MIGESFSSPDFMIFFLIIRLSSKQQPAAQAHLLPPLPVFTGTA
jgi:hypothetical protein